MAALCEKFRRTFQLKRKDGRLTGLPIDGRNLFSIPPVPGYIDESEVQKWAMDLAGEYNYARQHADEATAAVAWEAFRDLCEYALDQGAAAGGMNGPSGYFGHWAIATMREPLEKAGLYKDVMIANLWAHVGYIPITERVSRQGDASIGGTGNTDFIYGNYNTILRLMMNLPPAQRLQYLQAYSRILNMICDQQSPMCAYEPFEIDGAFIHHDMFNLNYGGAAYETLCNLASVLSGTQFQFTPGAVATLKRTAVLLAFLGNTVMPRPMPAATAATSNVAILSTRWKNSRDWERPTASRSTRRWPRCTGVGPALPGDFQGSEGRAGEHRSAADAVGGPRGS